MHTCASGSDESVGGDGVSEDVVEFAIDPDRSETTGETVTR